MDCLLLMSEGNPGAASVLSKLVELNSRSYAALMILDDMNIRGTQIWVAFKDYCNENLNYFYDCILSRDQGMIDKVNEEGRRGNHIHKAVKGGAQVCREFLTSKTENKRMLRPEEEKHEK